MHTRNKQTNSHTQPFTLSLPICSGWTTRSVCIDAARVCGGESQDTFHRLSLIVQGYGDQDLLRTKDSVCLSLSSPNIRSSRSRWAFAGQTMGLYRHLVSLLFKKKKKKCYKHKNDTCSCCIYAFLFIWKFLLRRERYDTTAEWVIITALHVEDSRKALG